MRHLSPVLWQPLFQGEEANTIRSVVSDLVDAIADRYGNGGSEWGPGLASGSSGIAVLDCYAREAGFDHTPSDWGLRLLDKSLGDAGELSRTLGLYWGVTGVGWTVAHICRRGSRLSEDPIQALDQMLLAKLTAKRWELSFDLTGGLVGLGVYALERLPNQNAARCLRGVLSHLADLAESAEDGLRWFSRQQVTLVPQQPQRYPVGMAHGAAAIVAFLGLASASDLREQVPEELLEGAASFLLSRLADASRYQPPVRMSWCWGDLGIAAALLLAARCVGNAAWEGAAIRLARTAAATPLETIRFLDASLCHGTGGTGHIFNRIYQATRDPVFADAARASFRHALKTRKLGDGIAGFQFAVDDTERGYHYEPTSGLLFGAGGLALALLASITAVEPDWDRFLLISIPPLQ